MQNNTLLSPIKDARVRAVIERLIETRRRPLGGSPINNPEMSRDPFDYAEYGFSICPEQGDLIYLLCRGMRATRVVDFATSIGMSAIYFAAAMRDNGGGTVIGSELVPEKVATARRNLADAGLADYADIREGDARQTLRDRGRSGGFCPHRWLAERPGAVARSRGYRNPGSSDPNGRLRGERQR